MKSPTTQMTFVEMRDLNIQTAKWHGWTCIENTNTMAMLGIWRGYPPQNALVGHKELLPDYLFDRNAMHAAVMAQDQNFRFRCYEELITIAREKGLLVIELETFDYATAFKTIKETE